MVSAQSKKKTNQIERRKKWREGSKNPGAHCAVCVLEEGPGLLVGAHFLHANLLQAGALGAPLLAGDQ